eukprot:5802340-Amphidinium_carterae.1
MSEPPKEGVPPSEPSHAHSGKATKTEPTEDESRVPREEARTSGNCPAEPPTWDDEDLFQGGRG